MLWLLSQLEDDDPLNTDDDASEEDDIDSFECENLIVCQYDKVSRPQYFHVFVTNIWWLWWYLIHLMWIIGISS